MLILARWHQDALPEMIKNECLTDSHQLTIGSVNVGFSLYQVILNPVSKENTHNQFPSSTSAQFFAELG